ncbi:DUF6049 family protein [Cellulomonas chengniuliangii]|uniref:DUF6049 family protein n=1 Tax=Cellulomonas chengniuliangii TaxID=2968084 RepID=A0ABY5L057_9CELL|nr:DUF6049 family protein [Cellulomonas chengniuliangii]MCC2307906.1 DUF6049 family protein [Cellulomonas chengniuliangii]MCC2318428.1 DUF6049 family protein [Cellulomonas chengniuliangii]UUI75345.1 DUF6049 family protein [Cellulomonas chengniuliangii]
MTSRQHAHQALLAALAVLVALLGVLAPVLPDGGTAHAAPAEGDLTVDVAVTAVQPQVLALDQDLTVTAVVHNASAEPIESPRATLRISRYRLASSERLSAWTESGPRDDAGSPVTTIELEGPLAPGASAQVVLTVPSSSIGLLRSASAWGPRGLSVELSDGSRRVGLERTFLLWAPSDDPADLRQVAVNVLVPVVGEGLASEDLDALEAAAAADDDAAAESADADAAEGAHETAAPDGDPAGSKGDAADAVAGRSSTRSIDTLTATGGRLDTLLQATAGQPAVTWAIDPALLDQAATGGDASRAWLQRLTTEAARTDVVALPWSDPDIAAIAHGHESQLLDVALGISSPASTQVLGPSPDTLLWLADTTPDQETAALAARSRAGALVVGSDVRGPDGDALVSDPTTRVDVTTGHGTARLLVPSATLDTLLATPNDLQPGATPATVAQRALAETAVAARASTGDSESLLVTAPRDWQPDIALAQAQLKALASAPWVQVATATELASGRGEVATLPDAVSTSTELSPAHVNALGGARADVSGFAQVVPEPALLLDGLDRRLLAPLAVDWRSDVAGRKSLVDTVLAEALQRRSGLTVLLSEQVTVAASSSQIRLVVRNTLEQPATVRVEMLSRQSCLAATGSPVTTVGAASEEVVIVDVRATSACDVLVDVVLRAEDGTLVSTPVAFSARVTPSIEDVGLSIVGALLAVGLVAGIVRTVRRGQTAHRGARLAAQAEADAAAAAAAAAEPAPVDPAPHTQEDAGEHR